ncbi:phospholipase D-like domain-containing protein [Acinetobacter rathckeae]|uniref:phospholipase D-like domain-containing protein n=1 Tax=Acinetobacter rathckeae TaxID=2605272 RepID=UPI0018A3201D|nr:phospholipase D-like domain-containing protein [Acinetobacter rathckeae]MBF7687771.1 phospholipase [Acinetobacter rathckeae]MBF7688006.1 phospholipase [Acinetobacter rathckeae]MBF7695940.1 phospholipase [Acinetobacter rathckeae]
MRIFQKFQNELKWSKRRYFMVVVLILFIVYLASAIYHTVKPLPEGLDYTGPMRATQAQMIVDQTFVDTQGKLYTDQKIFASILEMIQRAKTTIVFDMFLLNDQFGQSDSHKQRLFSQETVQALIEKKRLNPQINISVITDPINSLYGAIEPEEYVQLRRVGINVVETNLTPLRSSNPAWSGLWYLCCQGMGNQVGGGWLPNPLSSDKLTLRSYLNFFNFKTNHRKVVVVDTDTGWQALVGSKNMNAGGALQSNVAVMVHGAVAVDLLNSEQPVAKMSGIDLPYVLIKAEPITDNTLQAQVLTEKAIQRAVVNLLDTAEKNDQVDLTAFYLSDRQVIGSLKDAQKRGVKIRALLNPNQEAVARYKDGMPNQPVAQELYDVGVNVRWCEHCHSKVIYKRSSHGQKAELIVGSANLTARNLQNYNLETDLRVVGLASDPIFGTARQSFDQTWFGENNTQKSVNYDIYASHSHFKYWLYRFMEWSGFCSF